jgi:ribosomal-protein-alanine N-acetyltransferase
VRLPIETARLTIRPLREDDADALHEAWSDPEVFRYLPAEPSASVDETRVRLARHLGSELALWAVEERDSGEVVGVCGLIPVQGTGPDIEVAYHLARLWWGQGIATEAASACVAAGLADGLPRVVAYAFAENAASIRVLEKAGLHRAGTRQAYGAELAFFST